MTATNICSNFVDFRCRPPLVEKLLVWYNILWNDPQACELLLVTTSAMPFLVWILFFFYLCVVHVCGLHTHAQ